MKQVAIAARVSSDRQKEEQTIDSQIEILEMWAKENNSVIVGRYFDDGWSGEILARPALDQLRDDANKNLWEAVVFVDRDRLSRKLSYQELVIDELREKGKEVIFLSEPLADNPEGRIMQQIKGVFAEYERAKIAERMRRGKLHKARSGVPVNGPAPYGYNYIPKTKEQEGYYSVNEEEVEVVRKIFHWIADQGMTLRGVIRRLNAEGIRPRKEKRSVWSNGPICRLVRNEAYVGKAYYNKNYAVIPENPKTVGQYKKIKKSSRRLREKSEWLPISIPAILEEELFNRVQQQLALNKRFNPRNVKREYLLTSIVHCVCGRRRIGEGVREHLYYRCTDRIYNFPLPRECKAAGVNAKELDLKVWAKVTELLTNPELIKKQAEQWMAKSSNFQARKKEDLVSLQSSLKKLNDEEKRYLRAYGAGLMTMAQFQDQIKEIRIKKEVIDGSIKEANKKQVETKVDLRKLANLPERVGNVLESFDFKEKRAILREVLDTVVVGDSNKVLVKGYINVSSQAQKVGLSAESRNCRFTKRGEIHAF